MKDQGRPGWFKAMRGNQMLAHGTDLECQKAVFDAHPYSIGHAFRHGFSITKCLESPPDRKTK